MYSFLGTQLDGGFQEKRWNRWRPNVGIAASTDPEINTLVLLYNEKHKKLAEQVAQDAVTAANRMSFSVRLKQVEMDPYDLPSTYLMMIKLREEETFQPDTRYLFNLSTGTHIIQVAIYKMIESRRWPGLLAQCGPGEGIKSNITEIDLDLRAYDSIMDRYRLEDLKGEDRLKQGIPTLNKAFNTMVTKLQRVASKSDRRRQDGHGSPSALG
jgi:transcriptional regulatory protein RtcR